LGGLSAGVVAVSWAAIFIKLCGLPAIDIAAGRMVLAALFMAPFSLRVTWRWGGSLSLRERGLLLVSGGFLGLHFAAWVASLSYTSVASSVVLVTMNPIFVTLGSLFWLQERVTRRQLAGIFMAILGAICVTWADFRDGSQGITGDLLALAGAGLFSGYLLIGRRLRATLPTPAYTFPGYTFAAGLLLLLSVGEWQAFFHADKMDWVYLLLLAVVSTLIGHNCLNWILRYVTSPVVAVAILGEPVLATIFAYFLIGEKISIGLAVGGVLILVGVFLAMVRAISAESSRARLV
jgi:drug/metabolite transporter (DMT)-like permease